MGLDFFVATEEEVAKLDDYDKLFELIDKYEFSADGAKDFQDFNLVSEFFLKRKEKVQRDFIKTVNGKLTDVYINFVKSTEDNLFDGNYTFIVYKLERKFIEIVAKIDKEVIDNEESVKFWQSRGYFEQGIWNCVYGVHNLCGLAVRDGKNLYIFEEFE